MILETLSSISPHLILPLLFSYLIWGLFLYRKDKEKIKQQYHANLIGTIFTILILSILIIGGTVASFLILSGILSLTISIYNFSAMLNTLNKPFLFFWHTFYILFSFFLGLFFIRNKKKKKKDLRDISIQVIISLIFFNMIFFVIWVASLLSSYRPYVSVQLFFLTLFYFINTCIIFVAFKYQLFRRMYFKILESPKKDVTILLSTALILFILSHLFVFPHIADSEEKQKYVLHDVYNRGEKFIQIRHIYKIKNFGMYNWLPLKFNLNIDDPETKKNFKILINSSSGWSKTLIKGVDSIENYKSKGNITDIKKHGNTLIVVWANSFNLKQINTTNIIIEGYRKIDLAENFKYDYGNTFCDDLENDKSICRINISISNNLDKEVILGDDMTIDNFRNRGFNQEKCNFGNVSGTYSGKENFAFELDCRDKSCDNSHNTTLYQIDLFNENAILRLTNLYFKEKVDFNMGIEFICER